MTEESEPLTRLRHIGRVLKDLRSREGMLQSTSKHRFDRSPSSLSQLENGRQSIRPRDLKYILDEYGVPDGPYKSGLLELARQEREIREKGGWWDAYADVVSPAGRDYASLEHYATSMYSYDNQYIPGPLQTEEYAWSIISTASNGIDFDTANRLLAFRMERQNMLYRPEPVSYHAVLDEAVLRRMRGGREVVGRQLDRVMADTERDNFTIQVLPFSCTTDTGITGTCNILDIGQPSILSIVLVDLLARRIPLEKPHEVALFRDAFGRAAERALSEAASRDMIHRIRSEL